LNNHVYVIKTANGKYAKIIFTDFFHENDLTKDIFVTFKYAYQTNGSKELITLLD
jgi:hypothetical protein